jgi:ATP-dependent RNA helicase DeaD
LTKDFDKQDKTSREPSRSRTNGKGTYSRFQWDSVDDNAQEDLIAPAPKRKSAKTARRRAKDVGTMYVVSTEELYGAVKKKPIEQPHAEDFAQFRAEVEEGEEDPYAIPSYGGMKISPEVAELAEELAAQPEKKEKPRAAERKRASESKGDEQAEESLRVEKKTRQDAKSAAKADKKSEVVNEKTEAKASPKRASKAVAAPKTTALVASSEKPQKRSFLSKIQEAISTGRVTSTDEPAREETKAPAAADVPQLSAGKMRWLTQNAKKVLDSAGVDSDALCSVDERSQVDVLAGLLEALIKANMPVGAKQENGSKPSAGAANGKRATKAEEIFDVVEKSASSKPLDSDDEGRQDRSSRSDRKSAPKAKKASAVEFDANDPIAYWENLPDDDESPQARAQEKTRERGAAKDASSGDDFDEWHEVEAKKKSAQLREDAQGQSLFETPVSVEPAEEGSEQAESEEPAPPVAKPKSRTKKTALKAEPDESAASDDKSAASETKPKKRPVKKASDSKRKKPESKQLEQFGDLVLTRPTLRALQQMGYVEPTPIQAGTIPSIQRGVDLMGQAKTGTGKTAAFMIPIVEAVAEREPQSGPLGLVVAPTRELAVQIRDEAKRIAKYHDLDIVACYGGKPIGPQVERIRRGVDILVGTPGRIIDLMKRGVLSLAHVQWVVLDEADRMLDIGFRPDVEKILRKTPNTRQTLLFSATLPPPVVHLAKTYMKDPEQHDFSMKDVSSDTIDQYYLTVDQDRKFDALVRLLETQDPRQTIVFCRTKRTVDMLGRRLARHFEAVEAIHGDLPQVKRDRIMSNFRAEKTKILVATDIVGRGIDVSTVSHIINYDVPQYCDDYVHRVGRAGRMGREGVAFTLVTAEQGAELTRIEIRINRLLERIELPGFEAYFNPVEDAPPPERKPVFGQSTRRLRRAL